jgi:hypothetical protein
VRENQGKQVIRYTALTRWQALSLVISSSLHATGAKRMLWIIFAVLLALWFLGMVSAYTVGGLIHILLALAVITLIFNLMSGRRSAA